MDKQLIRYQRAQRMSLVLGVPLVLLHAALAPAGVGAAATTRLTRRVLRRLALTGRSAKVT
jgi:hypothetical protein